MWTPLCVTLWGFRSAMLMARMGMVGAIMVKARNYAAASLRLMNQQSNLSLAFSSPEAALVRPVCCLHSVLMHKHASNPSSPPSTCDNWASRPWPCRATCVFSSQARSSPILTPGEVQESTLIGIDWELNLMVTTIWCDQVALGPLHTWKEAIPQGPLQAYQLGMSVKKSMAPRICRQEGQLREQHIQIAHGISELCNSGHPEYFMQVLFSVRMYCLFVPLHAERWPMNTIE